MLTNYHTHTFRCQHANGTVEDYVREAIAKGFDILGMSDHVPYPHYEFGYRMPMAEIWDYIYEVEDAQKKYRKQLQILLGFESEYLCAKRSYYEELLEEYQVEYLVLGQHFFDYGGSFKSSYALKDSADCVRYAKSVAEGLSTGYFSLLAHPDIVGVNCLSWDKNMDEMTDIILEAAMRYDVPLEVNANGIRRGTIHDKELGRHYMYPHFKFWEKAAAAKVPTVISSDCHMPSLLYDADVLRTRQFAEEMGINIIEKITIKQKSQS